MRRFFPLFSISAHAVAIVTVLVVQIFAVGPLPSLQRPLTFEMAHLITLNVPLPPPAPQRSALAEPSASGGAPLEVPNEIGAERPADNTPVSVRSAGDVVGVSGGGEGLA